MDRRAHSLRNFYCLILRCVVGVQGAPVQQWDHKVAGLILHKDASVREGHHVL